MREPRRDAGLFVELGWKVNDGAVHTAIREHPQSKIEGRPTAAARDALLIRDEEFRDPLGRLALAAAAVRCRGGAHLA